MSRRDVDVDALVERACRGEPRAVGRLITLVENDSPLLRRVAAALTGVAGQAQVVGITGSPGVGKSTSTSALVAALRVRGERVGVLAVDPSSPFSGGALLGDRVRMQEHATDDGVFIRSMASRGQLGGLSAAVPQALRVLDAAGCDIVLVETVGVGQAEVEIASLADTTLLILAPGFGDAVQAAKAGVMEIADVFVVNKTDRPGADRLAREVRHAQTLGAASSWRAPVVRTVASEGTGVDDVLAALHAHREHLGEGGLARRREARARAEVEAIALGTLHRRFGTLTGLDAQAARVAAGGVDYTAADALIAELSEVPGGIVASTQVKEHPS